jgi:hypothetical protein
MLTSRWTVEFLVNTVAWTGVNVCVSDASSPYITVSINSSGKLVMSIRDVTAATMTWTATNAMVLGTTYHVAVTYDLFNSQLITLYLNGVQADQFAAGASATTVGMQQFCIGGNLNSTSGCNAKLQDVAFYPRVLTASQVAAHQAAR